MVIPWQGGGGCFWAGLFHGSFKKITILGNTDLPKHGPLLGNSKGVEPHEAPMSRRAPKAPSLAPPSPPQSTGILASYICKSFIFMSVEIHSYTSIVVWTSYSEWMNTTKIEGRISLNSCKGRGTKRLKSVEPGLEPQHRSLLIPPTKQNNSSCIQMFTRPLREWIRYRLLVGWWRKLEVGVDRNSQISRKFEWRSVFFERRINIR